jgi:hypothetical protein
MVKVITFCVLLKEGESLGLRLLIAIDNVISLGEIDLVLVPDDLTL